MGQRTVYDCDCCGNRDVSTMRVSFPVGTCTDSASGRQEIVYDEADVCASCLARLLVELTSGLTSARARCLADRYRKNISHV